MPSPSSVKDKAVRDLLSQTSSGSNHYFPSPHAWEDQQLYFLLPDRFSDGNEDGSLDLIGGTVRGPTNPFTHADNGNAVSTSVDARVWEESGTVFQGGTLKGIKSKLGYLKRLGITALWIGPIFKQAPHDKHSYHGYAVQDFLEIDPHFGSGEDLQQLVKEAHKEGIYVILDIILNHSGDVFAYKGGGKAWSGRRFDVEGFRDSSGKATLPFRPLNDHDTPNNRRDCAIWPTELQMAQTFTCEGAISNWDDEPEFLRGDFHSLKDIDLGSGQLENFTPSPAFLALCEAYKYWIAYADLDGYRIDTVKHMGDAPTRRLCTTLHEFASLLGKDNFLLVGEVTGDRAFEVVELTGLDAALGIGNIQEKLWKLPKGYVNPAEYFDLFRNATFLKKGTNAWMSNKLVTMIDDHDQVWRSGNQKGRFCSDAVGDKVVLAALALNLTTLGIPCIYYGTEQSFDGSGGSDRYIRETMFGGSFGAFRSKERHFFGEANIIFQECAKICDLRKKHVSLRRGRQYLREISSNGRDFGVPHIIGGRMKSIVAWSRIFADHEILCAINTDTESRTDAFVTIDAGLHAVGQTLTCIYAYPAGKVDGLRNEIEVIDLNRTAVALSIPPSGFEVYMRIAHIAVAFSPDGKQLTSAEKDEVTLWNSAAPMLAVVTPSETTRLSKDNLALQLRPEEPRPVIEVKTGEAVVIGLVQEQESGSDFIGEDLRTRIAAARQETPGPLLAETALDEGYDICLKNLELCLKKTHYAAVEQRVWVRTKLSLIEQQLVEHRLRMKIWGLDCLASENGLSAVITDQDSGLRKIISRAFQTLHEKTGVILDGIDQIWDITMPLIGSSSARDDSAIVEAEKRILSASESLTVQFRFLAEIQPSIQMAQAIHLGIGPQADLREHIKRAMERESALPASDNGSVTSEEYSVSSESDYEQCPSCQAWMKYYALSTHMADEHSSPRESLPQPGKGDQGRNEAALKPEIGIQGPPFRESISVATGLENTGDLEGKPLTNVAKIVRCINHKDYWKPKGQDGTTRESRGTYIQIVHYQPGVGLGTGKVSNTWDAMTSKGISKVIRAAYTFICLNWSRQNDQIVLIGFSRGAFTVRCVAQFIEEVGLLMKSGLRHLPKLFKIWKSLSPNPADERRGILTRLCDDLVAWGELVDPGKKDVSIEACAVWDTVSAIGFPMAAHLPQLPRLEYRAVDHIVPRKVKFAVQSLALDERRRHFKPMVWTHVENPKGQILTQRWFAGNHSDVSGANKDMTLVNITLAWMIGQLIDKIDFSLNNIWAITTTRSWSRPSIFDDPPSTEPSAPDIRTCKVVATSPISSKLLRSQDSWGSFFQRQLGGSQSRNIHQGDVHYSVYIFHHLEIAEYRDLDTGEKNLRSDAIALLKFEGEILNKWAQHILCAHVIIKQTRDPQEQDALDPDKPLYQKRLKERLLDNASYESLTLICAILSAFHRLPKDCDDPESKPLECIFEKFEAQSQSTNTQEQRAASHSQKHGTFKFECIGPTPTSSPDSTARPPELVRDQYRHMLVLTRTFPLLIGRAHVLPKPEQRFIKTKMGLFKRQNGDEILPCKSCAKIWPETLDE